MRELLLFTIDCDRYGIWKDDIRSVSKGENIHPLPFAPASIAGLSVIDDRTVTLADLSVCMGYDSSSTTDRRILMPANDERSLGFLVSGNVDCAQVDTADVLPLPRFISIPILDSCAVLGNVLVPIVNVLLMSGHLCNPGQQHACASFVPTNTADAAIGGIRIVELGKELYAVQTTCPADASIKPAPITQMRSGPKWMKGIALHNKSILPVIDLASRIKAVGSNDDQIVVVRIDSNEFGLPVGGDRGVLSSCDVLPLPLIAQTQFIRSSVIHDEQIVPLIELSAVFDSNGDEPIGGEVVYNRSSDFDARFKHEDMDVIEFSLLGVRHSVPKSEVEDISRCTPFRKIPGTPDVVLGVAIHNGELLPVIDPAIIFGMRSIEDSNWSMMLVRNQDFRALVLVEAVNGERRIVRDMQRDVPLNLPHHLVYGCYPEQSTVRLILNMRAISVHSGTVLGGFSPVFHSEKTAPHEIPATIQTRAEIIRAVTSEIKEKPLSQEKKEHPVQPPIEQAGAVVESLLEGTYFAESAFVAEQQEVPAQHLEEITASSLTPSVSASIDKSVQAEPSPAAAVSSEVGQGSEEMPVREDIVPEQQASEVVRRESTAFVVSEAGKHQNDREISSAETDVESVEAPESKMTSSWSRHLAYVVSACMIVAIFYGIWTIEQTKMPGTSIQTAPRTSMAEPASKQIPLILEVPAKKIVSTDVYLVRKGDTLWSISMHFTGSPSNYPKIAGENRIADANLIFPGQKIRLVQTK